MGKGHKLPPGIEVRIQESVLRRSIDDKVILTEGGRKAKSRAGTDAELDAKFQEHKARFRTGRSVPRLPQAVEQYRS